jgi:predicted ATPase
VPFAFATGLGIAAPPDRDIVEDITRRLRQKRVLLIVDNCEHLLSAVADVVERIVAMCPAVTVLATSREPLMVSGERLVPVQSLAESDAERLFIERAHTEAPDLVIEDEQAAAVSELCRRLDCLPLAIELAASRVRAFTPIELVANLDERFRLLIGGRRSRMERHQTMRGTLDWSYELCNDTEQAVFDRLSVFPPVRPCRGTGDRCARQRQRSRRHRHRAPIGRPVVVATLDRGRRHDPLSHARNDACLCTRAPSTFRHRRLRP